MRGVNPRDTAQLQGQLWTPDALRGVGKLAGWWDAGDIAQITIATGVSALRDKAGVQNASQGTAGSQRSWSAIGWRGRMPSLTGSGSKYVTFSGIAYNGTNGMSTMTVVEQNASANYRSIMSGSTGSHHLRFDNDHKITLLRLGEAVLGTTAAAVATGYHLVGTDTATSLTNIWLDGTAVIANSNNPAFSAVLNCLCEQNQSLGEGFDGAFGESVVSPFKWSDWERQRVEGYLAWKWDGGVSGTLVGQLPAAHPYKNMPPLVGGALRLRRPQVYVAAAGGFFSRYYYDMSRAA